MIQLNKLSVTRAEWGDSKGQLSGTVEFTGPHGKVELPLDEQMSKEIIEVCADALVRSTRAVAENMTADIINDVPALNDPRDKQSTFMKDALWKEELHKAKNRDES